MTSTRYFCNLPKTHFDYEKNRPLSLLTISLDWHFLTRMIVISNQSSIEKSQDWIFNVLCQIENWDFGSSIIRKFYLAVYPCIKISILYRIETFFVRHRDGSKFYAFFGKNITLNARSAFAIFVN